MSLFYILINISSQYKCFFDQGKKDSATQTEHGWYFSEGLRAELLRIQNEEEDKLRISIEKTLAKSMKTMQECDVFHAELQKYWNSKNNKHMKKLVKDQIHCQFNWNA